VVFDHKLLRPSVPVYVTSPLFVALTEHSVRSRAPPPQTLSRLARAAEFWFWTIAPLVLVTEASGHPLALTQTPDCPLLVVFFFSELQLAFPPLPLLFFFQADPRCDICSFPRLLALSLSLNLRSSLRLRSFFFELCVLVLSSSFSIFFPYYLVRLAMLDRLVFCTMPGRFPCPFFVFPSLHRRAQLSHHSFPWSTGTPNCDHRPTLSDCIFLFSPRGPILFSFIASDYASF